MEEQLAVAGYRLADVLIDALSAFNTETIKKHLQTDELKPTMVSTDTSTEESTSHDFEPASSLKEKRADKLSPFKDFSGDINEGVQAKHRLSVEASKESDRSKLPSHTLRKIAKKESPNLEILDKSMLEPTSAVISSNPTAKKKKRKKKLAMLSVDKPENNEVQTLFQNPDEFLSDNEDVKTDTKTHSTLPVVEIANDSDILKELIDNEEEKPDESLGIDQPTRQNTGFIGYI